MEISTEREAKAERVSKVQIARARRVTMTIVKLEVGFKAQTVRSEKVFKKGKIQEAGIRAILVMVSRGAMVCITITTKRIESRQYRPSNR